MSKEGNFHIYGLTEAKMGVLDERAINQLELFGSRETMALIVENVNEISNNFIKGKVKEISSEIKIIADTLLKYGSRLAVTWEEKGKTRIPKMNMELHVPWRFNGSHKPEDDSLKIRYSEISSGNDFKVVRSGFSTKDIVIMKDIVLERLGVFKE